MNYQEMMNYIENISQYGSVPGLDNIRELLARLDNPQNALKFVHIAGTNGKGSTLAYISTVLAHAGYKTGRYISPTISDYRERFQINGRMITKKDVCAYMERIKQAADSMQAEGLMHPTIFEVETALGFLYFKEKQCDIVVLETGLGGTLDATNIITTTLAAVIASISMDHMAFLGDTLDKIAENKVGIIKNNCYVITAKQEAEVMHVIEQKCEAFNCELRVADFTKIEKVKYGINKQCFSYKTWKNIVIHMAGKYQIANCILAIETLEVLAKAGYPVSTKDMLTGLEQTQWHGRFSVIAQKPLFVIDGAHNEDAAKKLAESIQFYFTNKRIIYIMGVLRDKEYVKMIEATHCAAEHIITVTPPHNPRALQAYELTQEVQKYHSCVTVADSLEEAVEISYLLAKKDTVIIAFGSLSYLGALTEIVKNKHKIRRDSHGRSKED